MYCIICEQHTVHEVLSVSEQQTYSLRDAAFSLPRLRGCALCERVFTKIHASPSPFSSNSIAVNTFNIIGIVRPGSVSRAL